MPWHHREKWHKINKNQATICNKTHQVCHVCHWFYVYYHTCHACHVCHACHACHVYHVLCSEHGVQPILKYPEHILIQIGHFTPKLNSIGTTTSCCNSGNLPFNNFGKTRWDLACPTLPPHWFFPCPLARKWWDSNLSRPGTWRSPSIYKCCTINWMIQNLLAWKKRLFQPKYPFFRVVDWSSRIKKTPLEFETLKRVCESQRSLYSSIRIFS